MGYRPTWIARRRVLHITTAPTTGALRAFQIGSARRFCLVARADCSADQRLRPLSTSDKRGEFDPNALAGRALRTFRRAAPIRSRGCGDVKNVSARSSSPCGQARRTSSHSAPVLTDGISTASFADVVPLSHPRRAIESGPGLLMRRSATRKIFLVLVKLAPLDEVDPVRAAHPGLFRDPEHNEESKRLADARHRPISASRFVCAWRSAFTQSS